MSRRTYFVHILANRNRTLCIGVTNDFHCRIGEHKSRQFPGFAQKYYVLRLVYFEAHADVLQAIAREKQLKRLLRSKKVALIQSLNPDWRDLSSEYDRAKLFVKFPCPLTSRHPNLAGGRP